MTVIASSHCHIQLFVYVITVYVSLFVVLHSTPDYYRTLFPSLDFICSIDFLIDFFMVRNLWSSAVVASCDPDSLNRDIHSFI